MTDIMMQKRERARTNIGNVAQVVAHRHGLSDGYVLEYLDNRITISIVIDRDNHLLPGPGHLITVDFEGVRVFEDLPFYKGAKTHHIPGVWEDILLDMIYPSNQFFGCSQHPKHPDSDWDEELTLEVLPAEAAETEEDDERNAHFAHTPGVALTIRCMDNVVTGVYDFETWDKIVAQVAEKRRKMGL